MIHPHTELRTVSSTVGLGVFATRTIPRGTVVWALDPFDLRIQQGALDGFPAMLRELVVRHAHAGSEGELVFCWDHARYVNHSCRPNCVELGLSFELASRTIEAGEELTCDYDAVGTLLSFECRCGAPGCRGPIGRSGLEPSDADLSRADAELVELASALARAEAQPLLAYAAPEPVDRLLLRGGRRAS